MPPARPRFPATVAAATGGFVLGVAAFMLYPRCCAGRPPAGPWPSAAPRKLAKSTEAWTSPTSRSFLVDVHLLNKR